MSNIKMDELYRRLDKLDSLERELKSNISQGYICGLINGIRLSKGIITGEEIILERDEVQPAKKQSEDIIVSNEDGEHFILRFGYKDKLIGIKKI